MIFAIASLFITLAMPAPPPKVFCVDAVKGNDSNRCEGFYMRNDCPECEERGVPYVHRYPSCADVSPCRTIEHVIKSAGSNDTIMVQP